MDTQSALNHPQSPRTSPVEIKPRVDLPTFLKQVYGYLIAGILVSFPSLAIQLLTARISVTHLAAVSLITYISLPSQLVGTAIGQSMLPLLNKGVRQTDRERLLKGGFLIVSLAALILAIGLFLFDELILHSLSLKSLPSIRLIYRIYSLASVFLGLNVFCRFAITAIGRRKDLTAWDFLACVLLIMGGIFSLLVLPTPEQKFIGISVAMLASQSFLFIYFFRYFNFSFKLPAAAIMAYLHRTKDLLSSEFSNTFCVLFVPLMLSLIFNKFAGAEEVAAYGVGMQIYNFVWSCQQAILLAGTILLASSWSEREEKAWDDILRVIFISALTIVGIPAVLAILGTAFMLENFFSLHTSDSKIIVCCSLLSLLTWIPVTHFSCQIRVFEKIGIFTKAQVYSNFFIGIPLVYYFLHIGSPAAAAILGILGPGLVRLIFIYSKKKELAHARHSRSQAHGTFDQSA